MNWPLCALIAILLAVTTAGTIVVNGICTHCSTPRPDVNPRIYVHDPNSGQQGNGNSYNPATTGGQPAPPNTQGGAQPDYASVLATLNEVRARLTGTLHNNQNPNPTWSSSDPAYDTVVVSEGFSGRLPDGTCVHNSDCIGCTIVT